MVKIPRKELHNQTFSYEDKQYIFLKTRLLENTVSLAFLTANSRISGLIEDNPSGSLSFLSRNLANAAALFVVNGPPGCANLLHK